MPHFKGEYFYNGGKQMAQLKMYWLAGTPVKDLELPEGYSFSTYKCEADKMAWVECCKKGLVSDDADEKTFDDCIVDHDDVVLEEDVFFLDYNGEHIGTITAPYHPHRNHGGIHMVGIREDFRGRGLGKYLNNKAIKKLSAQNVDYIVLTTDEWRKGAVKSYLSAGLRPVEYDEGMQERWEAVITEYGIDKVDMVDEDCAYVRTIYRKGYTPAPRLKVGVVGAGRGQSMMEYCVKFDDAELVAVCDNWKPALDRAKKAFGTDSITFYDSFDEFINHDMDAVVLANYANEHAPLAIRCLEKGLHVMSEVLPVQTMKEAVELVEAIEKSEATYVYAENDCFVPSAKKMRELYRQGVLGEFEYGEGEYMHNCEAGWHSLTSGNPDHWRNTMHCCYYCTHSTGPLFHITGLRPVSVAGFEVKFNERMKRMGAKAGPIGLEIITLENGAIVKSVHGVGPARDSTWYSLYGSKGRMESAREDDKLHGGVRTLYVNCDENEGDNKPDSVVSNPKDEYSYRSDPSGHGGADFYIMHNFVEYINGNKDADVIDIYEALDMFLPGMFAYRSILRGSSVQEIPDLRRKEDREKWRNDTECTDPAVAGDMLVPSYSKGNPEIPQENYDILVEKLRKENEEKSE